jgi:hypothetical protein
MTAASIRRELANLRQTVRDEAALPPSLPAADESLPLARELAASFGAMVKGYREAWGLSPEEALARAGELCPVQEERILHDLPENVQWFDLEALARRDPALALRRWEEVRQAARQELRSGHRAARALEGCESSCWQRAQFLALRAELSEGWRPRNGLEQQLLDQAAQFLTLLWRWQETEAALTAIVKRQAEADHLPRLTYAEAIEEAATMAERYHGRFLRTLKALRDLRRYAPTVIVRSAGQVNVGGQQVNVAAGSG